FRQGLATVFNAGRLDLDAARQLNREGCRVEVNRGLHALIGAVFPRRVDEEGVLAATDGLAMVVLAVPDHRILARRPSRPRHGQDHVPAIDALADLVTAVPAFQVLHPLPGAGAAERHPKRHVPDREPVLALDPDGYVGTAIASPVRFGVVDLEVDN